VAAVGDPSRATTTAVRPQHEEIVVVASQALVPHDPHQGHGRAHSGSRSTGDHEMVEAPVGGDSALGRVDQVVHLGQPPSERSRCWWCAPTAT
jgi:hypothetical protein